MKKKGKERKERKGKERKGKERKRKGKERKEKKRKESKDREEEGGTCTHEWGLSRSWILFINGRGAWEKGM